MQRAAKLLVAFLACAILVSANVADAAPGAANQDILWSSRLNGLPLFWLMNGQTYQTWRYLDNMSWSSIHTNNQIAGVGDFNQDGNQDILWRLGNSLPAVWYMNGRTYVSWQYVQDLPWPFIVNTSVVNGIADFTHDGSPDVLWRVASNGLPVIWRMNHQSYVTWQVVDRMPWSSISTVNFSIGGAADFNQDGNQDILWRNRINGLPVVWLMNGHTYVTWKTLSGLQWSSISSIFSIDGVADMNKDGNQDILWRNNNNGLPVLWLMNQMTYVTWQVPYNLPVSSVSTLFQIKGVGAFGN